MTAELSFESVRGAIRMDNDDHYPKTEAICIENTHNILGGIALDQSYIDTLGTLAHQNNIQLHMDGARIFNAAIAQGVSVHRMCQHADSVSVCLSKGLGAPLGSVLVGTTEFIYLARRARKRCGGGMRQAGVVAAMGLYAMKHNVHRLVEDHRRASRFAQELAGSGIGFQFLRDGLVDTNLVFFSLPEHCVVTKDQLCQQLQEQYNIKIGAGYGVEGKVFRAAFHCDVTDEGVDRAVQAITSLCR